MKLGRLAFEFPALYPWLCLGTADGREVFAMKSRLPFPLRSSWQAFPTLRIWGTVLHVDKPSCKSLELRGLVPSQPDRVSPEVGK